MSLQTQPQVFTLLPSAALPPRQVRNYRRILKSSGATLHVVRPETWYPDTTWLIVSDIIPSLAFLCAIASAGTVRLTSPTFFTKIATSTDIFSAAVSCEVPLPDSFACVSMNLLWLGRLWLGAYAFWRSRTIPPFHATRVCVVGQMRPRGSSGSAAPTTAIIRQLLTTGGALIVSEYENPHFAIVASGLQPANSKEVAQLKENNVLCLASAFVVDLLGRVNANPSDYVLYNDQRRLCGSHLHKNSIPLHKSFFPVKAYDDMEGNFDNSNAVDQTVDTEKPAGVSSNDPTEKGKRNSDKINTDEQTASSLSTHQPDDEILEGQNSIRVPIKKRPRGLKSEFLQCSTNPNKKEVKPSASPKKDCIADEILSEGSKKAEDSGSQMPTRQDGKQKRINRCDSIEHTTANELDIKGNTTKTNTGAVDLLSTTPSSQKVWCKLRVRPPNPVSVESSLVEQRTKNVEQAKRPQQLTKSQCVASPVTPATKFPVAKRNETEEKAKRKSSTLPEIIEITSSPSSSPNRRHPNRKYPNQFQKTSNVKTTSDTRNVGSASTVQNARRKRKRIPVQDDSSTGSSGVKETSSQRKKKLQPTCKFSNTRTENTISKEKKIATPPGKPPNSNNQKQSSDSTRQKTRAAKILEDDASTTANKRQNFSKPRTSQKSTPRNSDFHDLDDVTETVPASSSNPSTEAMAFIEKSYESLLSKLGGEPTTQDFERLKKLVEYNFEDSNSGPAEPDVVEIDNVKSDGQKQFEDSPQFDDEDEDQSLFPNDQQNALMTEANLDDDDGRNQSIPPNTVLQTQSQYRTQVRSQRQKQISKDPPDVMSIPIPKRPIILRNAFLPEYIIPTSFDTIQIIQGHGDDDRVCQRTITSSDWMLAAENGAELLSEFSESMDDNDRRSAGGRVWVALMESKVIFRLVTRSELSEGEAMVLSGICMRLVTTDPNADRLGMFFENLCEIRQKQLLDGTDSLHLFLTSGHPEGIFSRHQAVVAMWISLIQTCSRQNDPSLFWGYFDKVMFPKFEQVILENAQDGRITRNSAKEKIRTIVDMTRIIGIMFAGRLDVSPLSSEDSSGSEDTLLPDNWKFICQCINFISKQIKLPLHDEANPLTVFFKTITFRLTYRFWPVTIELLTTISRSIQDIYGKESVCSCQSVPIHMADLGDSDDQQRISEDWIRSLKTPCEFLMFFGWLHVSQSHENASKRVMAIVRLGATFKKTGKSTKNATIAINHNIGLLLSIAESVATINKQNEAAFCKMLTTRCPRLDEVSGAPEQVSQVDNGWRATLEAISRRCSLLIKKSRSVHVYINWLTKSASDAFRIVRKLDDSTSTIASHRENLRVKESVLTNLITLILSEVNRELDSLYEKVKEDDASVESLLVPAATVAQSFISQYIRISDDLLAQIRAAPGETLRQSRYKLLLLFLHVTEKGLQAFMGCYSLLSIDKFRVAFPENQRPDVLIKQHDSSNPLVSDTNFVEVLKLLINCQGLSQESQATRSSHITASRLILALLEYRWLYRGKHFNDEDARRTAQFLHEMHLDFDTRNSEISRMNLKEQEDTVGTSTATFRVNFWSGFVKLGLASDLLVRDQRFSVMLVTSLVFIVCDLNCEWNAEDKKQVHSFLEDIVNIRLLDRFCSPDVNLRLRSALKEQMEIDDDLLSIELISAKADLLESVFDTTMREWDINLNREFANRLKKVLHHKLFQTKGRSQQDALLLYSVLLKVEANVEGLKQRKNVRWIHSWLRDIKEGLEHIGRQVARYKTLQKEIAERIQVSILSSLSVMPNEMADFETRTLVLRTANTFDEDDSLCGVWKAELSKFQKEQTAGWQEQAARNLSAWKVFLFHSVIEHPLVSQTAGPQGKPTPSVLRQRLKRLKSAASACFAQGPAGRQLRIVVAPLVARLKDSNVSISVQNSIEFSLLWREITRIVEGTG